MSTDINHDPETILVNSPPTAQTPLLGHHEAENHPRQQDGSTNQQATKIQHRHYLTIPHAIAIVLSIQIGSGLFATPWLVSNHVSSPAAALGIWIAAGALVWTGAASFVELGTRMPRNGGVQEYLRDCYGEGAGGVFAWMWVLVRKGASMAVISGVCVEYLIRAVGGVVVLWTRGGVTMELPSRPVVKAMQLVVLAMVSVINCWGAKSGAQASGGFSVLKVLSIVAIVILGLSMAYVRHGNLEPAGDLRGWFDTVEIPGGGHGRWDVVGHYTTALFGVLWSYSGWESVGFIAGEFAHPRRDIPLVVTSAMLTTIGAGVFMNISLYTIIPFAEVRNTSTPFMEFAQSIMGPGGAILLSLMISASTMGTLNAGLYATARVSVAASNRGYFPAILANRHINKERHDEVEYYHRVLSNWPSIFRVPIMKFASMTERLRLEEGVPIYAIIMMYLLSSVYVLTGTFTSLVTFIGLVETTFFMLAVLGLLRIRWQQRQNDTQQSIYKTWIWNPAIFVTLSISLIARGLISNPLQGVAIGLLSLICWFGHRYFGIERSQEEEEAE